MCSSDLEVDEVDGVARDVPESAVLPRRAQNGEVLGAVVGGLPRAGALDEDLRGVGADRARAVGDVLHAARCRDVRTGDHPVSIGSAATGRPPPIPCTA